jgi:hypothetical protein
VANILIMAVSAALLVYWFRYTCLLILRTRTAKDYATDLAAINGLTFLGVQETALGAASANELSVIQRSLERDYRLLTYLLKQSSGVHVGGLTIEQRILMLDYKLMRVLFTLTQGMAISRARAAVIEMTDVLSHLANAMGERVQATSRS